MLCDTVLSRWIAHLDAIAHHEVLDAHRVPLADAVDAVDRLVRVRVRVRVRVGIGLGLGLGLGSGFG